MVDGQNESSWHTKSMIQSGKHTFAANNGKYLRWKMMVLVVMVLLTAIRIRHVLLYAALFPFVSSLSLFAHALIRTTNDR